VRAAQITGDQDNVDVKRSVLEGKCQIVFFTPEMLILNQQWRNLLSTEVYYHRLRALVVDEAHTIKKW